MKIFKNTLIVLTFLVSNIFISCNKDTFLDVNTDPNRVTDENITPYLIFPQAQHAMGVRQFGSLDFLISWLGVTAPSGDFVPDQALITYNVDFSFSNNYWANNYNVLFDLQKVKEKGFAVKDSGIAYVSQIMQVQIFQNLIDVFGNIPYSQAFNSNLYPNPKYDDAKSIYDSLNKNLDTAIAYLSKSSPSKAFIAADYIMKGVSDSKKIYPLYIKYANTLKLRLLIRQSEIPGFNPATEIAKILAKGGILESGESISVNVGYSKGKNQQSPFYAFFGYDENNNDASNLRANLYFDTVMKNNVDVREVRYFKPDASGNVITCRLGGKPNNPDDPTTNPKGDESSKLGEGLLGAPTQNQWIMTSVESLFLKAEATARGWFTGDPKLAYENALKESYLWLKVDNAESEATAHLVDPIANYDNPRNFFKTKAHFIAYQKYFSLAPIDPIEAWADLRRLDMIPDKGYISINENKISNKLPVRLFYPQSEYNANAENVLSQGNINVFESKLFWNK